MTVDVLCGDMTVYLQCSDMTVHVLCVGWRADNEYNDCRPGQSPGPNVTQTTVQYTVHCSLVLVK